MGAQMAIFDDDWELIPAPVEPRTAVAARPKSNPLPRLHFPVAPRTSALHRVSQISTSDASGSTYPFAAVSTHVSGPRLTVNQVSSVIPALVNSYEPQRHRAVHQVRAVSEPYGVTLRDAYRPSSLSHPTSTAQRFNPVDLSNSSVLQSVSPSVPDRMPLEGKPTPPDLEIQPLQRPPTKLAPTSKRTSAMSLLRAKKTSDISHLLSQFDELLILWGVLSSVYESLMRSSFAADHKKRLLDSYAATTCFRYFQAVKKFTTVVKSLHMDLGALTESGIADVLTIMRLSKNCDTDRDVCSGNFTIKALRWWAKLAGIQVLQIVYAPLIDSFLKTRLSKDRREAPPLPLWLVFAWERRILQSTASDFEIIMLGSFLFIMWAGLRFADSQRLRLDSLVFNHAELRGLIWRSKTSAAGHPFAIQASGLCSLGSFSWLFKFLVTWDRILHSQKIQHAASVDFLLPSMEVDGSFSRFEPLDYAAAMRVFRYMIMTPWKRFEGPHPLSQVQLNYTLHSLKATLLSFGPQLGALVQDSDRLLQGHHADPKKSLNLYGRDSVWGALRFQQTVITEIRKGWRPKTAQHRGGQFPLVEPSFTLETYKKEAPEHAFQILPLSKPVESHEVIHDEDGSELSDSDASSVSSDSSVDLSQPKRPASKPNPGPPVPSIADEAILARHRKVTHAMMVTTDGLPDRPQYLDRAWKAACGARMRHQDTTFLDEWSNNPAFCQHAACRKVWKALSLT